jgi:hypothetical protein
MYIPTLTALLRNVKKTKASLTYGSDYNCGKARHDGGAAQAQRRSHKPLHIWSMDGRVYVKV